MKSQNHLKMRVKRTYDLKRRLKAAVRWGQKRRYRFERDLRYKVKDFDNPTIDLNWVPDGIWFNKFRAELQIAVEKLFR